MWRFQLSQSYKMKEVEEVTLNCIRKGITEVEIIEKLKTQFGLNQNAAVFQVHEARKKIEEIEKAKDQYIWSLLSGILILLLGLASLTISDTGREAILQSDLPSKVKNTVFFPIVAFPFSIFFFYKSWKQFNMMKKEEKRQEENRYVNY
jgi:hypothetical protein